MAITNSERVGKALELLRDGLAPFVQRELRPGGPRVPVELLRRFLDDPLLANKTLPEWDVAAMLRLMIEAWRDVFSRVLGEAERTYLFELRDWRNRWAHQEAFTSGDADRVLDTASRLLKAVSAPQAEDLERMQQELRRLVFDEQVRGEKRKAGGSLVEAAASGAVKPWREVITPHPDVASGRYRDAEFAADLWQVHLGEGSSEYQDPREFFRRTYLTASLSSLLVNAARRLRGEDADPVVQLQTNFGGGKTHSMLALYHLFSGASVRELPGVEGLLASAGVAEVPVATRVVLVGNRISPGNPVTKRDGTVVRTLWGELAYQLGGPAAFERVRADDERATSPGDVLRELLKAHGPALVLIDEWVAYARQLHDENDLPAGTFDTQFTFAQALTESAKLAGNCLLVVSLPSSDTPGSPHTGSEDVEVGGLRGREALDRLRNVVARVEASWRPATAEEGFEIVRRRLFEPLSGQDAFKARDVTARAFADLYKGQSGEFPTECRSGDYERRIQSAYPIHPEVFDRLYTDWSTLVKFQRTRGVLRLMAAVIHSLWEKGDRSPLILPSTIPMDDPRVQAELTRYLSDNWAPIIERDVDGPDAVPLRLDAEQPSLGKLHATRRVARTIFLGSAPTSSAAHRGIDDRRVKLGCVAPGEATAVFGDALRRLAAAATYLYQDGERYWYGTQPTVAKLAEDRAEDLRREPDKVAAEIEERVKADLKNAGGFPRVHPFPRSGADVGDDEQSHLVVLPPQYPYSKDPDCRAVEAARAILESRGAGPRMCRNTLVFLAADKARLQDLEEAVRRFLAWRSIVVQREELNLDPYQFRQAETQLTSAHAAVQARLPETYQWLLTPEQASPSAQLEWEAIRLSGAEPLAVRAARKLRQEELLLGSLGPTILRRHMDQVPLWRGDHVAVRQLVEDFACYTYLPRLAGPDVLLAAVREGVALLTWASETFAYADAYDEAKGCYTGLRGGQIVSLTPESGGLLVKPDVARRQLDAEASPAPPVPLPEGGPDAGSGQPDGRSSGGGEVPPSPKKLARRFHGTVVLDSARVGRDAGKVAEEVIAHLTGLVGARVTVTLELDAEFPEGAPEGVVRAVSENCRTLKFASHGFEQE